MEPNIRTLLSYHSRLPLALLPTPLHALDSLRSILGPDAPRITIKRDDLTGLALGGNKSRKLEYLFADALKNGCDTLITCGAAQSNHALQTAAAARRFGFDIRCVLYGSVPAPDYVKGNLLLHQWLETPIRYVKMEAGETRREQALRRGLQEEADAVRATGGKPYIVPTGGSTAVGALGYVRAIDEIMEQMTVGDFDAPAAMYFASGSGGTHAGMALGARLAGYKGEVIGVEIDPIPADETGLSPFHRAIVNLTNETAGLMGVTADFTANDITLCADYTGPAYGVSTKEGE